MSKRTGDPGYAAGWCVYYRGISGPNGESVTSCEKGVEYSTFRHRQPCFLTEKGESKLGALPCEHLRRPTPEEITAHKEWLDRRWRSMATVMAAIAPWREEHRKKCIGGSQVIDCPACGAAQSLSLSIAAYNGHVHGRCTTDGCVSWME